MVHSEVIIALPPSGAEPLEVLAAQELRRAIYASSGELCDIVRADADDADESGPGGRSVLAIGRAAAAAVLATETEELAMRIGREEGAHVVSTLQRPSDARPHVIALAGHSPQATLFAVYTFAEEALGAQVNPDYVS